MTNRNICLQFAEPLSWQLDDDYHDACFDCTSCPVTSEKSDRYIHIVFIWGSSAVV